MIRRAPSWFPALAAVLLLAALAPTAGAATLTGQVVGATYDEGARVTVPVMLTDRSARAGKLTTSLVRLSLPRTARAGVAGGPVPVGMPRIGDAFSIKLTVPKAARKAAYPKLKAKTLKPTKRGAIPSAAELAERLEELKGYVDELASSTGAQIGDLRGQLTGMRGDLGTLEAFVDAVRAAIPGLPADPASTLATLMSRVTTLQSQVESLTSQLSGHVEDDRDVGIDVTAVNTQLATLLGSIGGTDAGALTGPLASLQTAVTDATSTLNFLCSMAGLLKATRCSA